MKCVDRTFTGFCGATHGGFCDCFSRYEVRIAKKPAVSPAAPYPAALRVISGCKASGTTWPWVIRKSESIDLIRNCQPQAVKVQGYDQHKQTPLRIFFRGTAS